MLILKLIFPWGRYYAHPWGHNPARLTEAEWPPSPWRLLRALAAGWFRERLGQPTADLETLLQTLGSELPDIAVSPVAFAHSVHWQPNYGVSDGDKHDLAAYKRTRHENHFVATSGPIFFRWNRTALDQQQERLLASILLHVSYFGRAESICKLTQTSSDEAPGEGWCNPCLKENGEPHRRVAENCRDVFCPSVADFQAADLWSRRSYDRGNHTQTPTHLIEDLLSHQPLPNGARWVSYRMPSGWPGRWVVRSARVTSRRRRAVPSPPRIAHYVCFSLQCRIPIPLKFTVPLAEQFRKKALVAFGRANGGSSSFALSGHEKPEDASGDHLHAFYLPIGKDDSRFVSDLHVWCAYGLSQAELEALMRVSRLDWGSGKYPIRAVVTAVTNNVPPGVLLSTGQFMSSRWSSRSPFVPPRYFYRGNLHGATLKAADAPEYQLSSCLAMAGVRSSGEIRRLTWDGTSQRSIPPLCDWEIVRAPETEEDHAMDAVIACVHSPSNGYEKERTRRVGLFFEIVFEKPVALPIPALGHSNHFGLGLFQPMDHLGCGADPSDR